MTNVVNRQGASLKNLNERKAQKNRTRKALVAAAEALLQEGQAPTVTGVAEAAGISRATAYRYFPTQEMLLAEVALFAAGGPLFPAVAADEPVPEAMGRLVRRVGLWAYANEPPLRTLFRLSLDPATGVRRPGHRREWIAAALAPAQHNMAPGTYRKLSKALTLMFGIDPLVVMKDIAGASREEALDALEWSARMLTEAALKEGCETAASPQVPSKGVPLRPRHKGTTSPPDANAKRAGKTRD